MRDAGSRSLYYFQKGLLQDRDLDPEIHAPLCSFMEGPGRKKLLCGFRGCLKSSTLRAWLLWMGLYEKVPDFSSMYVEQKYENAEEHHKMLQAKFRWGPQAALLQDMFADRLPEGLAGWTNKATILNRHDSNAEPFITIGSLEGKLEGGHRHAIVFDDLEGADSDKSDVPAAEARKFVFERAVPLLISPAEGWLVGAGTAHGEAPLVHHIYDKRKPHGGWDVWWEPILNEQGQTKWPARFPQEWCEEMQKEAAKDAQIRRLWEMQYMLRKYVAGAAHFNYEQILDDCYTVEYRLGSRKKDYVWRYETEEYATDPATGKITISDRKTAFVSPRFCRFFIHWDPAHKAKDERLSDKPASSHGMVVVGVSPDYHAFVAEIWCKEAPINEALEKFLYLYRKYVPSAWTFESVGAQTYAIAHIETLEQTRYRGITSLPTPWERQVRRIPRPSQTVILTNKGNRPPEEEIPRKLEPPVNHRWLHCFQGQEPLLHEFDTFGKESGTFDLLTALAQGPEVWEPRPSQASVLAMKKRQMIQQLRQQGQIYTTPWSTKVA